MKLLGFSRLKLRPLETEQLSYKTMSNLQHYLLSNEEPQTHQTLVKEVRTKLESLTKGLDLSREELEMSEGLNRVHECVFGIVKSEESGCEHVN